MIMKSAELYTTKKLRIENELEKLMEEYLNLHIKLNFYHNDPSK